MSNLVTESIAIMRNISRLLTAGFRMVMQIIIGLAATLPALAAPITPAVFAGWAVYQSTPAGLDARLRLAAAIAAAVTLETVGISAAHAALFFYDRWRQGQDGPERSAVGALLVVAYAVIGMSVIWLVEPVDGGVAIQIIGSGSFALALIAYLTLALFADMERAEAGEAQVAVHQAAQAERDAQQEAEADQWQRDQDQRRLELEYQTKIERSKINAQVRVERERIKAAGLRQAAGESQSGRQSAGNPAGGYQTERQSAGTERQAAGNPAGNAAAPSGKLPEWLPELPESRDHFRQLVRQGEARLPEDLTGEELAEIIKRAPRTGRDWLADVRNENGVA